MSINICLILLDIYPDCETRVLLLVAITRSYEIKVHLKDTEYAIL